MAKVIYVADDEKNIRELLQVFLRDSGYAVEIFDNGELLYRRFLEKRCDMVILDIMMPGPDGLEICKAIRKISGVPILMLTARDSENDFVLGMSIGSDDYITKPFRPTVLLMKIKAIFRRIELERTQKEQKDIHLGGLRISAYERKIYSEKNGRSVDFSMTEFALLAYLAENPNKAVCREECLRHVWGIEADIETRAVDETIRKVRKKLGMLGSSVGIETVWGVGYRLVER